MKKTTSLILIFVIMVSMVSSIRANTKDDNGKKLSNQVSIKFNENNYKNMDILEKGKAKLLESGYTEICVGNMPNETIEKIASAVSAEQTISYYTEDTITSKGNLKKISKKEFDAINIDIPQIDTESIDIIDEDNQIISGATEVKARATTSNVDGGTVKIVTTMYSVLNSAPSRYLVLSSFEWTSMPQYRGLDVFGITRDNNTVYVPNTFGNFTYHQTVIRNWYSTINGPLLLNTSYTTTQNDDLANSDSSITAFAIKYNLAADYIPSSVLVGSYYQTRQHYNLQGAVWYQGDLQQPSIQPTNTNHWSTYHHQRSTTWFSSPTFSYPWGASISISPTATYSPAVIDVILNTWQNNAWYNN